MKSQVLEANKASQNEFPRLMRHSVWGVVLVLEAGDQEGQVKAVAVEKDIGESADCLFLHMMVPFYGKVILES